MNLSTPQSCPLSELVEAVFDRRGVTPEKLGSSFLPYGHRVISAKHIKENRIDLRAGDDRFVDDVTYARWMRGPLHPGDVLVTSEAPLGEIAFVRDELAWCLGQRLFGLRPKKGALDGRYLYYALQSASVRADIQSRATGTTAQGIRQPELLAVNVPVPAYLEQQAIGRILGALDDKIELNRRTNETLEAMARAIFQSWFVDFDPVRAKMEGRRPEGMDAETARLFPASLVSVGAERAPSDWTTGPVTQVQAPGRYSCVAGPFGSNLTSSDYVPAGVPVIRGSNLSTQRIWMQTDEFAFVTTAKATELTGNLAYPGDVVMTQRGTLGQVGLVPSDGPFERYVLSQSQMKIAVDPEKGSASYVAMYFQQPKVVAFILGNGQQAGVPHVNLRFLREFKMLLPPPSIARAFDTRTRPILLKMRRLQLENRALSAARDALLPKLLSGELRAVDVDL